MKGKLAGIEVGCAHFVLALARFLCFRSALLESTEVRGAAVQGREYVRASCAAADIRVDCFLSWPQELADPFKGSVVLHGGEDVHFLKAAGSLRLCRGRACARVQTPAWFGGLQQLD